MSNITIAIEDDLIKQARVRALQEGTSLSAKVREFLQQYVSQSPETVQKKRLDASAAMMAAIDLATSQAPATNSAAAAEGQSAARLRRRTLREQMYANDFRAADRAAAQTNQA